MCSSPGSGTEANDTLVRMVRRYWELLDQPERNVIISRSNGYHGSTMAGASLGGMKPMHEQLGGLRDARASCTSTSRTGSARAATCRRTSSA